MIVLVLLGLLQLVRGFSYGRAAAQGLRNHMEDTTVAQGTYFAVFDGHAGDQASKFLRRRAVEQFEAHRLYGIGALQYAYAMRHALLDMDIEFMRSDRSGSGSTAVAAAVLLDHIVLANVGDSRAVIVVKGSVLGATVDHKPEDPQERHRIEHHGGFVRGNRVNGMLALSRAIGDKRFKVRPLVTAEADIYIYDRPTGTGGYVLLASDGFWDVFSNQQAAQMLKGTEFNCTSKAKELVRRAIKKGSTDNVSVVLIAL
jgi:serine/threonine protein phosphatase PrpC